MHTELGEGLSVVIHLHCFSVGWLDNLPGVGLLFGWFIKAITNNWFYDFFFVFFVQPKYSIRKTLNCYQTEVRPGKYSLSPCLAV